MVEYRHAYDTIIVQIMSKSDRSRQYSFTDIYNIVKKYAKGNPNVGKDTVQRHLNKMVEGHVLVRLPKEGRKYNKTLYVLSPEVVSWLSKREF